MDRRISEHNSKTYKGYTSQRLPVKLVYHSLFNDIREAISFEKQIKGWSRKKKEALIEDNWDLIEELAKCRNATSSSLRTLRLRSG